MCGLNDVNNSQMGSSKLYFKLIWLYILLLGYAISTVKNEAQISEHDKGQILHYHNIDGDINKDEVGQSKLLQTTSSSQSIVTRHFDSFSSNEDSVKHSEDETSDPWVITSSIPSESNLKDSSVFLMPPKSKTNSNLFSGLTSYDHDLDFTTQGESVYQWSLDNDDAVEAVYYSIYPDFTDPSSKLQFVNYNLRELRSIVDEDLQSFTEVSSTSELPIVDTVDSIQPTPVTDKSSALLITSNHQVHSTNTRINDSNLLVTSHKNTGIDDIINGLVHLLGDNVKVAKANLTDTSLSVSDSLSVVSMRINNRGPPTSVPLLTDEIVFTSLSYDVDTKTSDPTDLETYTTSETSLPDEIVIESLITNDITEATPLVDQIAVSTPAIDDITSTTLEDKKPLPMTTEVEIYTNSTQTHLSSETKFTDFTTTEVFVPTEPSIAGWRPVKPFNYDLTNHMHTNPQLPSRGTHTEHIHHFSTLSSVTATSESAYQPLIPSFYNSNSNNLHTTSAQTAIPSTEELSLITANEEYFGDILLTATGVMNGGSNPTNAFPTIQQSTAVKQTVHNNNNNKNDDESVFIDGRRQYFTLQNSDDTEGGMKSGVVENQPRPRPQTVKPVISKPTESNLRKRKPSTTSTIRIDTCIVGDDTACDVKNHEVCRTEGGVSSCTCPPGLARAKNSNECIAVISLLLYLRVDHINGQRLLFDEVYTVDSPEKEYVKHEAVQGITSLFRMSSLAPIFIELHFNSFYAIGGKLATNVTIMIQESPHTSTQLIKQVISRELISTLQQKNHSIGKSHLSVDSRFNPIPSIQDLNECADSEWNDCSINSDCENTFGSFKCNCWPGFTDKFSHDALKHGRVCTACSPEYCNNHGICILNEGKQECRCKGSYIGHKCEIDSEVLGVALGASLAALLIIILTFICLCMWSRRWKKGHQKPQIHSASPSFTYMDKTAKAHCDLHSLVSDNTLQWFPMRDTRNNFYSVEPPEMTRNPLALVPSHGPYSTIIRSNHLSHSQTKLMGSDDCINETPTTRFYVPRPKARLRTEYQNIYSDPIHDEEFINASRQHRPYDGQNLHPFYK